MTRKILGIRVFFFNLSKRLKQFGDRIREGNRKLVSGFEYMVKTKIENIILENVMPQAKDIAIPMMPM